MTTFNTRLMRAGKRVAVAGSAVILTAGLINATTASAQELTAGTVSNAEFTWGFNGYAQKGIFGPWRQVETTGNAVALPGTVSDATNGQTAYVPAAFPATSMPAGGKTPNVVRWTDGTGEVDADGGFTLEWDGSYTINAYPENLNAPDETISDPVLNIDADGSGTFVADFKTADGSDMQGDPLPGVNLPDITMMTFSEGALSVKDGVVTLNPDYQGVEVAPSGASAQVRNCTGDSLWGAWPKEFVEKVPAEVAPHYYSTACGGYNDNKAALPVELTFDVVPSLATPEVTISEDTLSAEGEHTVTVTGTGFNNPGVVGTRPPLAGKNSGAYVIFGKFANTWQPSKGASSSARSIVEQKWAVYPENVAALGNQSSSAVEIDPEDGSFTATLTVSKDAADEKRAEAGNYGIYTYAGGGAVEASYETYSPITFTEEPEPTEPTTSEPTTPTTSSSSSDTGSLSGSLDGGGAAGLGLLAIGGILAGGLAFAFANGMIQLPAGFAPPQFVAQFAKQYTSQVPVR